MNNNSDVNVYIHRCNIVIEEKHKSKQYIEIPYIIFKSKRGKYRII